MSKSKKALKRELRKFEINYNEWSNCMYQLYRCECEDSNIVLDENNYPFSRWLSEQFAERFKSILDYKKLTDGDASIMLDKYNFYFGLRMALILNDAERKKAVDIASDSYDRFDNELYNLQAKVDNIYENI